MRVRDCMTAKVFTVRLDKKLIVVQEMMGWARIRHIPVVDGTGGVVGIISHRDLLHAAISAVAEASKVDRDQHLATIAITMVMKTGVQTIGPDATIQEAAKRMREKKIGCLPVVEGNKLVGIISEYDLLGFVERT
jgi:CBS-domain-containing membrane protein